MNAAAEKLYQDVYEVAHGAGMKAAQAAVPEPMVVAGPSERHFVSEGACGFGWVILRPGTNPFCKWLKAKGLARAAYGTGVQVWSRYPGQAVVRNEAYAEAFASVITEVLGGMGVLAHAASRLD